MFTGLIQGLGTIEPLGTDNLQISCGGDSSDLILQDLVIGDSVSVDGICLTVVKILPQGFVAATSPETLSRTTLGQSESVGYVNLETSLRVGSKLGGHFVTGHIDGVGCLQTSVPTANSWEMTFTTPTKLTSLWEEQISPYLVPKGSIAVNGVSLTVADCDRDGSWFKVAVIPHTFTQTNLYHLKSGNLVNIEADILGKYVARLLGTRVINATSNLADITPAFLTEHGYI